MRILEETSFYEEPFLIESLMIFYSPLVAGKGKLFMTGQTTAASAPTPETTTDAAGQTGTPSQSPVEQATAQNSAGRETDMPPSVLKEVPHEVLEKLLRQHVWGAIGVGLVPIPIVDLVGLTGVQLNLIRKLAQLYEVPFFKEPVRNLLSSLISSTLSAAIAPGVASLTKFIPIIGSSVGVLSMSLVGSASTYAVGKVFIRHFASGGTFLTFNVENVKTYYDEMFEEGKRIVAKAKQGRDASQ
jgi:uncharacterized protein (DUF697 family)